MAVASTSVSQMPSIKRPDMSEKTIQLTNAPLYANVYPQLVVVARNHGYALAVHGSMKRDLDLIAVPWSEDPSEPAALVMALSTACHFDHIIGPEQKMHGRMVWTLTFPGECFVDLSVMSMEPWNTKL